MVRAVAHAGPWDVGEDIAIADDRLGGGRVGWGCFDGFLLFVLEEVGGFGVGSVGGERHSCGCGVKETKEKLD